MKPAHWHGLLPRDGTEPPGWTIARLKANATRHLPATVARPVRHAPLTTVHCAGKMTSGQPPVTSS